MRGGGEPQNPRGQPRSGVRHGVPSCEGNGVGTGRGRGSRDVDGTGESSRLEEPRWEGVTGHSSVDEESWVESQTTRTWFAGDLLNRPSIKRW